MRLYRLHPRLYLEQDGAFHRLGDGISIDSLLALPLDGARELLSRSWPAVDMQEQVFQAPIQSQEVWAAGVTYLRSRDARSEEAVDSDPYDRGYTAPRPELFFKPPPSPTPEPPTTTPIH